MEASGPTDQSLPPDTLFRHVERAPPVEANGRTDPVLPGGRVDSEPTNGLTVNRQSDRILTTDYRGLRAHPDTDGRLSVDKSVCPRPGTMEQSVPRAGHAELEAIQPYFRPSVQPSARASVRALAQSYFRPLSVCRVLYFRFRCRAPTPSPISQYLPPRPPRAPPLGGCPCAGPERLPPNQKNRPCRTVLLSLPLFPGTHPARGGAYPENN